MDDYPSGLDQMESLLDQGLMTFCDDVIKDLEIIARGEPILYWAKSVRDQRFHKSADWPTQAAVSRRCPKVIDAGADSSPQLCALAQAYDLFSDASQEVTLVTNDYGSKPLRISVEDAAATIELPSIRVDQFVMFRCLGKT